MNPRNLETVVNQRVFPENCGGAGPREQRTNSRGLRCHQAGKNAGVSSVARDPKEPDEREDRGRSTLVTAIQIGKGAIVCEVTEGDVANIAADDSMEMTISLLGAAVEKKVWANALKKPNEGFGGMIMSQNENVSIFARYGKSANTDVGSWDDKNNAFPLIQTTFV